MNKKESKGKVAEEPKKKKAEPISYNYPPIDYDALKAIPTLFIEVRYSSSRATDPPTIETNIPIDSTLCQVIQLIEEKHNNSLKNVQLYLSKEDAINKVY